jgi:hypothetical protein
MSKALKSTFMVHGIVAIVIGAPMLLAPGRFLGLFGWSPIDAILSRLLGAALLALGWSSLRGAGADDRTQRVLVEAELAFTVLGCVGLLRHLTSGWYPWPVWLTFVILAAFAIAWAVLLAAQIRKAEQGS